MRCVHPLVTLIEKLDALMRRFPRTEAAPATVVRHYEEAARIVRARASLPPLTRLRERGRACRRDAHGEPTRDAAPLDTCRLRPRRRRQMACGTKGAPGDRAYVLWPRLSVEDAAELLAWIAEELG